MVTLSRFEGLHDRGVVVLLDQSRSFMKDVRVEWHIFGGLQNLRVISYSDKGERRGGNRNTQ